METQRVSVASASTSTLPLVPDPSSSTSSFWSRTFSLSMFPFFIIGCPFHLLTIKNNTTSSNIKVSIIQSTKEWFLQILSTGTLAISSVIFLMIPTSLVNSFVIYELVHVFDHLFIRAQYTTDLIWDVIYLLRYMPIVVPLDYIWLRGYKIRNMIQRWDHLYEKFDGCGVASMKVRLRVVLMTLAVLLVNIITVFTYVKGAVDEQHSFWEKLEVVIEALLDLCLYLLMPLYCTFCYAIKFELLIVKGLVYKWIHNRVTPSIGHLNLVKQLFTEAANSILAVNSIFSLYLSVALLIIIVDTLGDSENLWKGAMRVLGGGGFMSVIGLMLNTANQQEQQDDPMSGNTTNSSALQTEIKPDDIRVINLDLAAIMITYALIFFMVRQAVATNDTAREINVWLNDFVVGGSGTQVEAILRELGVIVDKSEKDEHNSDNGNDDVLTTTEGVETPIWARTRKMEDGRDDEFIKKFHMLKAYIHVSMQTEKPALLGITLVGLMVPALSGRLRRYGVRF